jgi:hypothetical protein
VLTATPGASYKWYSNNVLIGAATRIFSPESSGLYKVEVFSDFGCSNMSKEVNVTITAIEEQIDSEVVVTPNPTVDKLYINTASKVHSVRVIDTVGRAVVCQDQSTEIDIGSVSAGVYVLLIKLDNGRAVTRRIVNM